MLGKVGRTQGQFIRTSNELPMFYCNDMDVALQKNATTLP